MSEPITKTISVANDAEYPLPNRTLTSEQWNFPDELKGTMRALMVEIGAVIPPWVRRIYVTYRPSTDPDTVASIETRLMYRQVLLDIHPKFFMLGESERRSTLIHEMTHASIAPLIELARSFRDAALGDDAPKPVAALAESQIESAMEAVTEDLTAMLYTALFSDATSAPPTPSPNPQAPSPTNEQPSAQPIE